MSVFSVIVLTAAPAGQAAESSGAFVKVDGREALLKSIELFLNRDNIKEVQAVVASDHIEEAKRKYGAHLSFTGVRLQGAGSRWMEQIASVGERIAAEATHVIVHDGARPAVPFGDIDALLAEAEKHDAVSLAAPVRNPLVELDEGGQPVAFHLASSFMNMLTPQVFSRAKFLEMAKSQKEPHASQFTLVKGSGLNIRVGGSSDAGLVKSLIGMLPKPKIKAPSSPFEEAQW